jgi:hypothetical protein
MSLFTLCSLNLVGCGATELDDPPDPTSFKLSGPLTQLHLSYRGPASPGFIQLWGWWQPPNGPPRTWGQIADCADTTPGDGALDCSFWVPSGSAPFEFQVHLPDGHFWGDESCQRGGCGSTLGTLTIFGPNGQLGVSMVPNNQGMPYYNGHIANVP